MKILVDIIIFDEYIKHIDERGVNTG